MRLIWCLSAILSASVCHAVSAALAENPPRRGSGGAELHPSSFILHPSEGAIGAVAFSPNGAQLAVGSRGSLSLLNAVTGAKIAIVSGLPGTVTSLSYSADGSLLAASCGVPGKSGEVHLYSTANLKEIRKFEGATDVVYSVSLSRDGKRIAGGSYDHNVYLWNTASAAPKVLKDHIDSVYAVAFSPDAKRLASAAGDRSLKIWDVASGRRLYTLSESTAELYSAAFSLDGTIIAAGGADRTLRIWKIGPASGQLVKSAFAHGSAILQVAYHPTKPLIVTSSEDKRVKLWNSTDLQEIRALPLQADWPSSVSVNSQGTVAVGTHNGALILYASDGHLIKTLQAGTRLASAPMVTPSVSTIPGRRLGDQKQRRPPGTGGATLFTSSLGTVSPSGMVRGATTRITLSGARISDASAVYFDDPAIKATLVESRDPNNGILRADVVLGNETQIGMHRCWVQAKLGATASAPFAVGAWPETAQKEPNDTPAQAQPIAFPTTLVGALDQPGDVDVYRFDAKKNQDLVFKVIAQPLRSRLQPVLTITDESGKEIARSKTEVGRNDVDLGVRFPTAGKYFLTVRDFEGAGGGDVIYRINAGEFPMITSAFPLAVQTGHTRDIEITGFGLADKGSVPVTGPATSAWGQTLEVPAPKGTVMASRRIAVSPDPEITAVAGNNTWSSAQTVAVPIGISARLSGRSEVAAQYYRFRAKKSEPLVIETMARRLGSPIDTQIEILDLAGRPVERAIARPIYQTEINLFDRDSTSTGIRIIAWDGVHPGDYMMVGRELLQVYTLPKGPDDDIQYRAYRGQRLGMLGTTPEYHSIGTPVFKVELHPPGSKFTPNGYPLARIPWANDDGGPLFGKDSHLLFNAPADGEYLVRVTDTRGLSGNEFVYHLAIHPVRPDFRITLNPEQPNVPRGGAAVVSVECERYDGFNGPIEVTLEGLEAGVHATTTIIEPGETQASIQIRADEKAPDSSMSPPFKIVGRAVAGGTRIVKTIEPDNGIRRITVLPEADIRVATSVKEVTLPLDGEANIEVRVDRQGKFGARVPIDVRNLPFGVRVQNVGLNGVLVTEQDDSREFTLYCEPWVLPQERWIYVMGNVEGGTASGGEPVLLRIVPPNRRSSPRTVSVAERK